MNCNGDYREHSWSYSNTRARIRDNHRCVTCGSVDDLEVNHIAPLLGRGYGPGCVHHLDNLETLCRPCHQDVTNSQRHLWSRGRRPPAPDVITSDGRHRLSIFPWRSEYTDMYEVEVCDNGELMLRPAVAVTDPDTVQELGQRRG